jgi:ATP/maltotriose-dependent transcriptional regulator MalT
MLAGHLDSAAALGREALALAREHGERAHEAWALHFLGEIAAHDGRFDAPTAKRSYREALALASELGMHPLAAHCHLGLGMLHRRTGETDEAREDLTVAAAMFRELEMVDGLAQAEAALA